MAKKSKRPSDIERLNHMLEAIDRILTYTGNLTQTDFLSQDMVQDAVIKNFEVIGEAAYHISKELKKSHRFIEWKKIEGLRHILVHDYYKINPKILWNTKENDIPDLCRDL